MNNEIGLEKHIVHTLQCVHSLPKQWPVVFIVSHLTYIVGSDLCKEFCAVELSARLLRLVQYVSNYSEC